ncbi:alkaline proteinase [Myriangium duriaei CBS 260.36]|uniref:Alkaline proteinase n=1 Tax=Myriangium duriaei CBS 260.36 TaxID=1168546 RepID=A0A9P4MLQ1_9PEZI|nr:alkaline proteinase [Myriangium duriaei CBS 260.36]
MHFFKRAGAFAAAAALLPLINALPTPQDEARPKPGPGNVDVSDRYIVTLKDGVNAQQHLSFVRDIHAQAMNKRDDARVFAGVDQQYDDVAGYNGYAGHFDKSVIDQLKSHADVEAVEADQIYTTFQVVEQAHATEGLDLISHRKDTNKDNYDYDSSAGSGTYGYVVDTGINLQHKDFEGRASNGYNAVKGVAFKDTAGHGTHVAGTMVSKTYGVAKKAHVIAVKVFDGESGSTSAIMDGYGWAVKDIIKNKRQGHASINMSLGGGFSQAFNKAVDSAYSKGVTTVVAAGNENADASKTSPASAKGAIAVAATDMDRKRAKFSNFGKVVNVFAPGVNILSTWIGSSTATNKISGTSMASPHIAGLVLYLQGLKRLNDAKASRNYLDQIATGKVVSDPHGSPNLFAYNGSGK